METFNEIKTEMKALRESVEETQKMITAFRASNDVMTAKFAEIDKDGSGDISQKEWIEYAKETKREDKEITRNTQISGIVSKLIDVAFLVLLVLSTLKKL